jgi:hypothetical protein
LGLATDVRPEPLRTVRVLTSKLAATAVTLQPSWSTHRTIAARPNSVVRAFLWAFIRVEEKALGAKNPFGHRDRRV